MKNLDTYYILGLILILIIILYISQILKLIGSSDIIGNPVKLLEGIGTGFYELVNEPRKEY